MPGILDHGSARSLRPSSWRSTEYCVKGKAQEVLPKVEAVARALPSVGRIVIVELPRERPSITSVPGAVDWSDWLEGEADALWGFEPFAFDQPLYILYSSGTTGVPKCIVHGAGGTLVQHLKEHQLHCDIRAGDRVLYFTTCGWMMWNWLVTVLASGATVVLYDGSPFHPRVARLFELKLDRVELTLFGTSAKFLDAVRKADYRPADHHALTTLRTEIHVDRIIANSCTGELRLCL